MRAKQLGISAVLVIIAMIALSRYIDGVRDVAILGIFSSGMLFGIALLNVMRLMRNGRAHAAPHIH